MMCIPTLHDAHAWHDLPPRLILSGVMVLDKPQIYTIASSDRAFPSRLMPCRHFACSYFLCNWDPFLSSILLTRCLFWRAGLMQNLVSMELDGNSLEGTLPNGLAAMSSLKLLDLSSNYLTGTLPADWTGSPRLTLLLLGNNLLTGKGPLDSI
jgi:hypothetical protein